MAVPDARVSSPSPATAPPSKAKPTVQPPAQPTAPAEPASGAAEAGRPRVRLTGEAGDRDRDRDLVAEIDALDSLTSIQRAYLRERWLRQLHYLGRNARRAQRQYYALRLVAILGGVTIPALVGLNVAGEAAAAVRWLTFGLGLLVAAAVALEEFFRFGERWRHYRQQSELLRGEGWAFLQRAGPVYLSYETQAEAFRPFVARVEETMRQEVGVFVAEIARPAENQAHRGRGASTRTPASDPDGASPRAAGG